MAKTLGLVITDGVGFRNFILSGFLRHLKREFDRTIIFSALPGDVFRDYLDDDLVIIEELVEYREPGSTWFFRKLKEVAHLKRNETNNFGFQDNLALNASTAKTRRGKLTRIIYRIAQVFNSESQIDFYYRLQLKSLSQTSLKKQASELLGFHKPDLLFFTHQRPPYIAPLLLAAKENNIMTSSFIFSWDNLASKGRMAGDFDFYLVWSDLMKAELQEFYTRIKANQINVVGTPQFEFYRLPEYSSKKVSFFERFELNYNLKTICFSCGDVSTSANDEIYIRTIAEAIIDGKLREPVNFIVRTSPAEEPDRFKKIKEEFEFIIWNFPKWKQAREVHSELWSQRVPTREDSIDLRMLLEYSDIGINMCSTMSLDFMVFDKPVINPVFGNKENALYDDQRFLKFAHYNRVVESGAVAVAKNREELIKEINFSLENPLSRLDNQRKLLKLQIGAELQGTGERISQTLKDFSKN
ncbi:hypothetical protein ACW6QP_09730 [Salegentibacter sp. HM20]